MVSYSPCCHRLCLELLNWRQNLKHQVPVPDTLALTISRY